MGIEVNWTYLVAAALAAVGIIEWLKGFPAFNATPSWVWRIILPLACIAIAILGNGGWRQMGTNAAILLAVAQIGYPLLVKLPASIIERKA